MNKNLVYLIGLVFLASCVTHVPEEEGSMGVEFEPKTEAEWKTEMVALPVQKPEGVIEENAETNVEIETDTEIDVAPSVSEEGDYMEVLAKKLRKELRSTGGKVNWVDSQIDLVFPNRVVFGTRQRKIHPSFESTLASISKLIKEYDKTMVQIIGYTDNNGSLLLNNDLSLKRANLVADFLRLYGVENSRIITDGAGPQNFIATNETKEGRDQNNRVDITLISIE